MTKDKYRKVEVVDHNSEWKNIFEKISKELREILVNNIIAIHHIGSTAIPNIKAKPIIDIIPVVKDIKFIDQHNRKMEKAGYEIYGEYGMIGRRFFVKFLNGERLANIHCFVEGNDEITRHILFRDYMINHPTEAKEYSDLKVKLAEKYPNDIASYMEGKDQFAKYIDKKTGFNGLSLREATTKYDWFNYHRIKIMERFRSVGEINYNRNDLLYKDQNHTHYVLYMGSDIIGALHLENINNSDIVIRTIAIDGDYKNNGYGTIFLEKAEKMLKDKDYKGILIHANNEALNFYKRHNYIEKEWHDRKASPNNSIGMSKIL